MRVLYLGALADPTNSESEIARALERLGHDVIRLAERGTDAAKLIAACAKHRPDVLLGAKFRIAGADGFDGPSAAKTVAVLDQCRPHVGKICCWLFDALLPAFAVERWHWSQAIAPAVDLFACTDGLAADQLPNSLWLPQGSTDLADDEAEWPTEFAGDILFLGTAYRERRQLVDQLRVSFGGRFRIVPGRGEKEVRGRDLTALVRSFRICICPPTPTWDRYWSNRLITIARHGGLCASPIVRGMLDDGWVAAANFLSLPTSPASIATALKDYLASDPAQLSEVQLASYEHAKRLTYDLRCQQLLAAISASVRPDVASTESVLQPASDGNSNAGF